MKNIYRLGLAAALFAGSLVMAEDWKPIPRRLPGKPSPLNDDKKDAIVAELVKLEARAAVLRNRAEIAEWLPDAEVYLKAVRFAIDQQEFFGGGGADKCTKELAHAAARLDALEKGEHPWADKAGSALIGYRSIVDGSVQPFLINVPKELDPKKPAPLYVWLHGRGDTDTDIHFINGHESGQAPYASNNVISIQPFGRNCLGYKAAAEMDVLEAIATAKRRFKIDPDRVLLMGFSMGGAGAWNIGAHYAGDFAAVYAGAGYVDVVNYQKIPKDKYPVWYEQKLWGVNDGPDYVRNFFNTVTVGYGGENDGQKLAGLTMAEAFKTEGREMMMLIGPGMGHGTDKGSDVKIRAAMEAAAVKGREPYAKEVFLQTRTLRYNRMKWVSLEMLQEHWLDSRIDGQIVDDSHIVIKTKNAAAISLHSPFALRKVGQDWKVEVKIDDSVVTPTFTQLQGGVIFINKGGKWIEGALPELAKRHGLQGPIDDAFMDSFLVVTPSAKCASPAVDKWVTFELEHLKQRSRDVFRGDLPMKKDTEVTAEDKKKYNLILWGDEASNVIIKEIAGKLPIKKEGASLVIGDKKFDAATHVPLLVYPSPFSGKYIVLNSGPTFREDDDGTNSRQNPKLPDWAIVDATVAPNDKPLKVADADFFDETWQVRKKK